MENTHVLSQIMEVRRFNSDNFWMNQSCDANLAWLQAAGLLLSPKKMA